MWLCICGSVLQILVCALMSMGERWREWFCIDWCGGGRWKREREQEIICLCRDGGSGIEASESLTSGPRATHELEAVSYQSAFAGLWTSWELPFHLVSDPPPPMQWPHGTAAGSGLGLGSQPSRQGWQDLVVMCLDADGPKLLWWSQLPAHLGRCPVQKGTC